MVSTQQRNFEARSPYSVKTKMSCKVSERKNSFNPKMVSSERPRSNNGDQCARKKKSQQSIRSFIYEKQQAPEAHVPVRVQIIEENEIPINKQIIQNDASPITGSVIVQPDHSRVFSNAQNIRNQSQDEGKTHKYTDSIHIISSGQVTSDENKSN